jgi:hypothetical protein
MMNYRVVKMWYRILRQHGMRKGEALVLAWSLRKPTVNAIDEHGEIE